MAANLVRRYEPADGPPPAQPVVRPVPGRPGRRAPRDPARAPAASARTARARGRAASGATSTSTARCARRTAKPGAAPAVRRSARSRTPCRGSGPATSSRSGGRPAAWRCCRCAHRTGGAVQVRRASTLDRRSAHPRARTTSTTPPARRRARRAARRPTPRTTAPSSASVADELRQARLGAEARPGGRPRPTGRPTRATTARGRRWPTTRSRRAPTATGTCGRSGQARAGCERELVDLRREVRGRTESLARQFDRVLRLLEAWGYLDGWALTDAGERAGPDLPRVRPAGGRGPRRSGLLRRPRPARRWPGWCRASPTSTAARARRRRRGSRRPGAQPLGRARARSAGELRRRRGATPGCRSPARPTRASSRWPTPGRRARTSTTCSTTRSCRAATSSATSSSSSTCCARSATSPPTATPPTAARAGGRRPVPRRGGRLVDASTRPADADGDVPGRPRRPARDHPRRARPGARPGALPDDGVVVRSRRRGPGGRRARPGGRGERPPAARAARRRPVPHARRPGRRGPPAVGRGHDRLRSTSAPCCRRPPALVRGPPGGPAVVVAGPGRGGHERRVARPLGRGPAAHPDDGLLDVFDAGARLRRTGVKARRRLPHRRPPAASRIDERRATAVQSSFDRPARGLARRRARRRGPQPVGPGRARRPDRRRLSELGPSRARSAPDSAMADWYCDGMAASDSLRTSRPAWSPRSTDAGRRAGRGCRTRSTPTPSWATRSTTPTTC